MPLRHTFRAFRHRDNFVFWCGLFLGHTGTLLQTTAQGWLIFQLQFPSSKETGKKARLGTTKKHEAVLEAGR